MRILLPVTLIAVLTACGSSEPEVPATEAPPAEAPAEVPAAEPAAEAERAAEAEPAADPSTFDAAAALNDPSKATLRAPETYTVQLDTTEGPVLIDVHREWAPKGADRFYNLVKTGFYDDVAFFRVLDGFVAQVGIHGDPAVNTVWREARIQDDPPKQSNTRGTVTFATGGPNTRTTQIFINYGDNKNLDAMGFTPFGKVRDMAPVDALHKGYGEGAPRGQGPNQMLIQQQGNEYLKGKFPELDYIEDASIVEA